MTPVQRPRPGQPVTSYTVQVCCPRCGGRLVRRAEGTPGLDTRAVASCTPCNKLFALVVELRDVTAEVRKPEFAASEEAA